MLDRLIAFALRFPRLAFLCLLAFADVAYAQAASDAFERPGASPVQVALNLLQSPLGVILVTALVAAVSGRHLLKAFADKLMADAAAAHHGAAVAAGERVGAHLLTSLDKYLEESQHDVVDVMTDPGKRAVAAQTLKERARSELPGAVQEATAGLGSSFLDGAVSAALDAAHLKAQAIAAGAPS